MGKNLNKKDLILIAIIAVSLISSAFLGLQLAILLCLSLLLIYLIITKRYFIKVYKGMKSYKLEDYETALEYYRDAAMSKYCNGPIISNYLICELKYGKPSLAREYNEIKKLKNLIKNNKNTYIYETLTSLLLCSGRFTEAEKYTIEAMDFNSDNNIIKSNYAEICFKLDKFDEAKKEFDYLIEENVHFIEPYYYSALIERKNGNCDRAFELLRTAEGLNESLVSLVNHKDINQALNSVLIKSFNQ